MYWPEEEVETKVIIRRKTELSEDEKHRFHNWQALERTDRSKFVDYRIFPYPGHLTSDLFFSETMRRELKEFIIKNYRKCGDYICQYSEGGRHLSKAVRISVYRTDIGSAYISAWNNPLKNSFGFV